MAMIDKHGPIDVQIRAHAGLGRALAALGKGPAAAAEYAKVKASFRDPERVLQRNRSGREKGEGRGRQPRS
jgi:uncharacterized protein (UPF0254 family)